MSSRTRLEQARDPFEAAGDRYLQIAAGRRTVVGPVYIAPVL